MENNTESSNTQSLNKTDCSDIQIILDNISMKDDDSPKGNRYIRKVYEKRIKNNTRKHMSSH